MGFFLLLVYGFGGCFFVYGWIVGKRIGSYGGGYIFSIYYGVWKRVEVGKEFCFNKIIFGLLIIVNIGRVFMYGGVFGFYSFNFVIRVIFL